MLPPEQWISLLEQGDSASVIAAAPQYVGTKGFFGESSLLIASRARAFKTLRVLLSYHIEPPSLGDLEAVLFAAISEVNNPTAFDCLHTAREKLSAWFEEDDLQVADLLSRSLDLATKTENQRVMYYLASILDDASAPHKRTNSFCSDSVHSKAHTIHASPSNLLAELRHLIHAIQTQLADQSPEDNFRTTQTVLSLLLTMFANYSQFSALPSFRDDLISLKDGIFAGSTPALIILQTAIACLDEFYTRNGANNDKYFANTPSCFSLSGSFRHSSELHLHNDSRAENDVSKYIGILNTKIYEHEAEILRLRKKLEVIRHRHKEEAEINGKLTEALSEQLKVEIDRSLMLEKRASEKDEMILSLQGLLKVYMKDEDELGIDKDDLNIEQGLPLAAKYIDYMKDNLVEINDSFLRLDNERQSLSMIQKHVLGLEYEQERLVNDKNDLKTELIAAELAHYRRLYFSLKAQYEAMVSFLPRDTADLAIDVMMSLIKEETKEQTRAEDVFQELEMPKTPIQLAPEKELTGDEQSLSWGRYMNDGEYQRYVEHALTSTGLSSVFQGSSASVLRPWSAAIRKCGKPIDQRATNSFY